MVLSGHGNVFNMALADKGVCEEAAGNNCGVYHREDDLKTVHKRGEYGGIQ